MPQKASSEIKNKHKRVAIFHKEKEKKAVNIWIIFLRRKATFSRTVSRFSNIGGQTEEAESSEGARA
jgi:hypothetical protein